MKLKVEQEFDIIGRGKVFTLNANDNNINIKELKVGMLVSINDLEYRIRDIEKFRTSHKETNPTFAINVIRYYKPL